MYVVKHVAYSDCSKSVCTGTISGIALQAGRMWVRFQMESLRLLNNKTLPAALWPWGQLSL